ncbi:hypothetical protein TRVL_02351 [Trypanosoma vivax]|nr:hypothetical protein TRVL_02351 [Trypanosoma vivax]
MLRSREPPSVPISFLATGLAGARWGAPGRAPDQGITFACGEASETKRARNSRPQLFLTVGGKATVLSPTSRGQRLRMPQAVHGEGPNGCPERLRSMFAGPRSVSRQAFYAPRRGK